MDPMDRSFHQSNKPRWSADGILAYATSGNVPSMDDGILRSLKGSIVSEHKDIRFAKLVTPVDVSSDQPYQRAFVLINFRLRQIHFTRRRNTPKYNYRMACRLLQLKPTLTLKSLPNA